MPFITKQFKFCAAHKYWNKEWSEDKNNEILLNDALKIDKTMSVGDICIDILDPSTFGRRLINTAKHHLLNKIKDVEELSNLV